MSLIPNIQPQTFSVRQYLLAIREIFLYNDRSFGVEKKWLNIEVAKQIQLADPAQELFKVDWDSEISFSPKKEEQHQAVCVWIASEFKTTYEQHLLAKELSEKERQRSYRYIELRDQLRKKVVRQFFSTGVDSGSKTLIEDMVDKLIKSRSEIVARQFGINFRDLLQADKDLAECQKKNRIE